MKNKTDDGIEERIRESKRRARAAAFLRRCKDAGIPDKFMRIGREEFKSLLPTQFYGGKDQVDNFVENIYNKPRKLLTIPFIIIDGGDSDSRKMAGFALLFRLITSDCYGFYKSCGDLAEIFQSFPRQVSEDRNRDIWLEELKKYDVLFIGEYDKKYFRGGFDTGDYFDHLLEHRGDYEKTTIISFTSPTGVETLQNSVVGKELARLSAIKETNLKGRLNRVLKIRVKVAA